MPKIGWLASGSGETAHVDRLAVGANFSTEFPEFLEAEAVEGGVRPQASPRSSKGPGNPGACFRNFYVVFSSGFGEGVIAWACLFDARRCRTGRGSSDPGQDITCFTGEKPPAAPSSRFDWLAVHGRKARCPPVFLVLKTAWAFFEAGRVFFLPFLV